MMKTKLIISALSLTLLVATSVAGAQPRPGEGAMPEGPPPGGMPPRSAPVDYQAAVLVRDGEARVDAASTRGINGKMNANAAAGITIRSSTDHYNGLLVRGHSDFTLSNATIDLSGKGLSDFDGIAAGALVKDEATMVLKNVRIHTRGVVSTAVTATDKTVLKVYHSTLVADGGPVPSAYVRRIGPGMMEPPAPLGIVGTARTSLTMGEAKAYYYDSKIIADGWGALSTDAAHGAYLEVNRCDIRVLRSGYGSYADNGATVVINDSKMHVASFGGIIAGQASMAFNNVQTVSGGNAVMIHSVMGSPMELARLTIRGGRISSTNAAILVKSANADILIEDVRISAKNADLLLAVVNDDAFATKVNGQPVAGIHARIRNTRLEGNIIHLDTDRHMAVSFTGSTLKGAIRDAAISLDASSRWTATADSRVLLEAPTGLAQIDALKGVRIEARADPLRFTQGEHVLPSGGVLVVQ